jgi:carboxypeptidase family protein
MKNSRIAFIVFFLAVFVVAANAEPKRRNDSGRLLNGQIVNHNGTPLADSVVYLTNMRTRVVKSYIVSADGAYHFPALTPNVDYEVYAQYRGLKSETKTLSQFDDRPVVSINLKIDMR